MYLHLGFLNVRMHMCVVGFSLFLVWGSLWWKCQFLNWQDPLQPDELVALLPTLPYLCPQPPYLSPPSNALRGRK